MNTVVLSFPWFSVHLLVLGLGTVLVGRQTDLRRQRLIALWLLGPALVASVLGFALGRPNTLYLDPLSTQLFGPRAAWFGADALSLGLIPFSILIGFVSLLGSSERDRREVRPRVTMTLVFASLLCETSFDLVFLLVGFALSVLPALGMDRKGTGSLLVQASLGGSVLLFALGLGAVVLDAHGASGQFTTSLVQLLHTRGLGSHLALPLVLVAVMLRSGIFPFHTWVPSFAEKRSPLFLAQLLAPGIGPFVLLRVGVALYPTAFTGSLFWVAKIALLGTLYTALMSLASKNGRRVFGWLAVSQASLILVGLESQNLDGMTGGLIHWLSAGLSIVGLSLALTAVEARLGSLDLRHYAGLFRSTPQLGGLYLVIGFSLVGIPGTLGFAGEDLIVHGLLASFPILGIGVVLATAVNGFVVLRSFFRIFAGPRKHTSEALEIRAGARVALVGVALLLILLGFVPHPVVTQRASVGKQFLSAGAEAGHAAKAHEPLQAIAPLD